MKQYRIVCDMKLFEDGRTTQFFNKIAPLSKMYYADIEAAERDLQMISEACQWENLSYDFKKSRGVPAKFVTNIRIQEREISEWTETEKEEK